MYIRRGLMAILCTVLLVTTEARRTGGGSRNRGSSGGGSKPSTSSSSGGRTDTGSDSHIGWKTPQPKPEVTHESHGVKPAGWNVPDAQNPRVPSSNPESKTPGRHNSAPPPSANIGPGGYPVQAGQHTPGFTHPKPYNPGYTHHGSGVGPYSPPAYTQQSYSSHYGFTPNYYPSHNSFGYPGQGMFGNSNARYGGAGLFGGGTGYYGYPGSGHWGYPSYGTGSSSGSMTDGIVIGYLTSSLQHRLSNPWGYSAYGYGHSYGYDHGHPWHTKHRHASSSTTPAPEELVQCVGINPQTGSTQINPKCSCSVTTTFNPVTNANVTNHFCVTDNGKVVPWPDNPPLLKIPPPEDPKKREFFSKLEKIVRMGNFSIEATAK